MSEEGQKLIALISEKKKSRKKRQKKKSLCETLA